MQILCGDLFYCNLNPVTGSEQGGIRPVLVIQGDIGNKYSSTVIVAAITSRHKAEIPTHFEISGCGLRERSTILLEQLRTVDKSRLRDRIGHVPPEIMEQVMSKLDISFGRETKDKGVQVVEKLTVIENSLIPVYQSEKGTRLVNMRELHSWLGIATKFADWIKDRIEKYDFVVNQDYIHVSEKRETSTGATVSKEYIFRLEPAKEIAMVENNEKGKEIRRYFIKVEEKFKQQNQIKLPTTYAEALRELADKVEENQKLLSENSEMKPKAQSFDTFMNSEGNLTIEETAKTLNINGVGRNNLFKVLVTIEVLFKKGEDYEAYQNYINSGYFIHKQNPVKKGALIEQRTQVFVTPKGLDWLAKKLAQKGYKVNCNRVKQVSHGDVSN